MILVGPAVHTTSAFHNGARPPVRRRHFLLSTGAVVVLRTANTRTDVARNHGKCSNSFGLVVQRQQLIRAADLAAALPRAAAAAAASFFH